MIDPLNPLGNPTGNPTGNPASNPVGNLTQITPGPEDMGIAEWLKQFMPTQFSTNPVGTPSRTFPMGQPLVPSAAMSYRSDHPNNYSGQTGNIFANALPAPTAITPQNRGAVSQNIFDTIKSYSPIPGGSR